MKTCKIFTYVASEKGFRKVEIGFTTSENALKGVYAIKWAKLVRNDRHINVKALIHFNGIKVLSLEIDKADKKEYREYLETLKRKKAKSVARNKLNAECNAEKCSAREGDRKEGEQDVVIQRTIQSSLFE